MPAAIFRSAGATMRTGNVGLPPRAPSPQGDLF